MPCKILCNHSKHSWVVRFGIPGILIVSQICSLTKRLLSDSDGLIKWQSKLVPANKCIFLVKYSKKKNQAWPPSSIYRNKLISLFLATFITKVCTHVDVRFGSSHVKWEGFNKRVMCYDDDYTPVCGFLNAGIVILRAVHNCMEILVEVHVIVQ